MIRRERVTVDGEVAYLGQKVDPETAVIEVDGVPLPVRPDLVYYLLYKPRGTISTVSDPEGRETVVDLVPPEPRVVPVGRLDADSEGLLILSNDGDFINRVTHPSYGVTKTYLARVAGSPGSRALNRLVEGVELEDGPAAAVAAKLVDSTGSESLVEIVMGEGRNREVRRMLAAIGHPVTDLVRTAIGSVRDQQLAPGRWRRLEVAEIRLLYGEAVEADDRPADVVAIDGPGGVGKTTTARAVASATGRAHLDTGAMYRAATLAVLEAGIEAGDEAAVVSTVAGVDIGYEDGRTFLDGRDVTSAVRSSEVDAAVSEVSAYPVVRERLVEMQRAWVERHGPSVVEGRDIGTVVFAGAKHKFFLTADPEVRAERRSGETAERSTADIADELTRRDAYDSSRDVSPLRPAEDAVTVDTTSLSIGDVVATVMGALSES